MQNQQRHLAAILFTDIVGYTAMMQKNEDDAVRTMKRYTTVLQKAVRDHNGHILNDFGDGNLCSFPSATEAVQCAVELQKDLQQDPKVPLRVGLHIGEIFFEDGKVMGDGVNVASRIQSLGQANTILFSSEINNKIKNRQQFTSTSLGKFEFKNVDDPVEVFALSNDGFVVPKREEMSGKLKETQKKSSFKKFLPATGIALLLIVGLFVYKSFSIKTIIADKDKTIAILPFKNVSINKEENEPFCVGVALELQKKLELMGGLLPIASQSVEKFRDTKLPIGDIASQLGGIRYILQGTVQRDKNKIKVYVSLSDVMNNKEKTYDFPGEVEDIFSLQENIAQQIASELQVEITPDEQNRLKRIATKNTAAIDAYNDALTSYVKLVAAVHPLYWDSLPSNPKLYSEYQKTLSLCDKVINIDSSMAEAFVLKGQTYDYSIRGWFASNEKRSQVSDRIRSLANHSLIIDKSSAEAYLLLSRFTHSRDSVLMYLEKALACNTNSFEVNAALGEFYSWDDPEKAIRFFKKATRLNPLSIWTPDVYKNLGFSYMSFGDFEKAEFYGKKAVELAGNSMIAVEAKRTLTIIYSRWGKADSVIKYANQYLQGERNFLYELAEVYCNLKNDCGRAAEMYKELWNRYGNHSTINRWAVALLASGNIKEGKEKLDQAFKEWEARDTLSYDYAGICALNGEREKALSILKQCNWKIWGFAYLIQQDKMFDSIRNEKEFKDMLSKALDENEKLKQRIKKLEEKGEL